MIVSDPGVTGSDNISDEVAFDKRDVSTGFLLVAGSAGRGRFPIVCSTTLHGRKAEFVLSSLTPCTSEESPEVGGWNGCTEETGDDPTQVAKGREEVGEGLIS